MQHVESNTFDVEYSMSLIIKREFGAFNVFFAENAPAKLRSVPMCLMKVKIENNAQALEKLLDICEKKGDFNAAGQLALQKSTLPSSLKCIFNRVISTCAKFGDMDAIWMWWGALVAVGYKPDAVSLNIFLSACARSRNDAQAKSLMRAMISNGKVPTLIGISSLIDCFAKVGQMDKAEMWFDEAMVLGIKLDVPIFNILINAYAKAGNAHRAAELIAMMPKHGLEPHLSTYNAIINACARLGEVRQAEYWYSRMVAARVRPDGVTFCCMIKASARCGEAEVSGYWLKQMVKHGYAPTAPCYNLMVHACAQCSDLRQAEQWLEEMEYKGIIPNIVTYTCLLGGYTQTDDWDGICHCVEMMAKNGLDKVALDILLKPTPNTELAPENRSMRIYCIVIGAMLRVGALNNIQQLLVSTTAPSYARIAHQKFRVAMRDAKSEADFVRLLKNLIAKEDDINTSREIYPLPENSVHLGNSEWVYAQTEQVPVKMPTGSWLGNNPSQSAELEPYHCSPNPSSSPSTCYEFDGDDDHFFDRSSSDSSRDVFYL